MDEKLIFQAAVKIYIDLKGWNAANSGEFSEDELMDRAVSEARALAEKVRGSAGNRVAPPPVREREVVEYFSRRLGGRKDLFLPLDAILADFENRPGVALLLNKMATARTLGKCASLIDGDNPLYSIGPNFPLYGVGE